MPIAGRGRWTLVAAAALAVAAPARGEITFFPVPEIIVDPNEGTTLGVLGVVLFSDPETRSIRRIVAPDVRYNRIFGVYPTFRYFDFPTPGQRLFVSAGKSTRVDEYFEFNYSVDGLLDGRLDLDLVAVRDRDSRERFFGIGNDTGDEDESNYTGDVFRGRLRADWRLPDDLRVTLGGRVRHVRVRRGGVDDLPYTGELFDESEAPGIDGETVVGVSAGLRYDTRDIPEAPSIGSLVAGEVEAVDRAIGSTVSYLRWRFDARTFQPLRADRKVVLAAKLEAEFLQGGKRTPFYELASLGGVGSLRGYGSHRFRDRHRIGARMELRWNVYQREIFGIRAALEATPFVDIGKVFADSRESPFKGLKVVPGLALRAVVRPQVVAYVDVGFSGGGVAAFTGIDYPF